MSSLGLLSGYCSGDSSDTSDSFETTPQKLPTNNDKKRSSNVISNITTSDDDSNSRKSFNDLTATSTSAVLEKQSSFFDVSSNRDEESSTTEEDEEESDTELSQNFDGHKKPPGGTLPLPALGRIHSGIVESLPGSVFSNPFKEAEESKRSVLEHHVALGPSEVERKDDKTIKFGGKGKRRRREQDFNKGHDLFDDRDSSIRTKKINRTKVGVAPGLVPSRKYMKLHEQHQAKERPWTVKK